MANTVALSVDKVSDEIGARFRRLNLPQRPLIMEKSHRTCPLHKQLPCLCYEYTTLLERPEYAGKYLRESPEPEVRAPKPANGSTTTTKRKLKLDQYMAGKSSTPKSEQRSSETSPNNATNAPASNPSSQRTSNPRPAKTAPSSLTSTPTSNRNTSSKAPKASVPAKRSRAAGHSPDTVKTSSSSSSSQNSVHAPTPPEVRPTKRQRTSPPLRSAPPLPPAPSARHAAATPTLPLLLPALLSPTLPKAIEDALAAEDVENPTTAKVSRAARATPNGTEKPAKQAPSSKKLASSTATPSGRSPRPIVSPGKTLPKKPGLGTASKTNGKRPASPNPSKTTATASKYPPAVPIQRSSCMVKLKFRHRRKDFQSLCKLLLSANKRPPRTSQDESNGPTKYKGASQGSTMLSVPAARASSARSPAFKSPAFKPPKDNLKDTTTPPPKKTNGAVLKKPEAAGGGAAITPSASGREERNGIVKDSYVEFNADYEKFSAMGKDCKHEADAVFRISPQADPKEHKRALVVAVDSTLCFILAFVLSDRCRALEKRMPPSEMWRTFIPLSLFVSDKAKNSNAPGLHGFCKQMEAIVRQHLYDMDLQTFSKTSLPEHSSKAPTPDSSNPGNDRSAYATAKTRLIRDSKELKECWTEGLRYLTYDDMQTKFPATYGARSKEWVEPAVTAPKVVGEYRVPFMLPLHRSTTPLEGINFGRKFLEEWAQENGVRYKSRLGRYL